MMPDLAIILAGGKGTRLQSVVSDLPKPLAPVGGRPFLAWQLDHLAAQGIQTVVLSIGHMADAFEELIGHQWKGMTLLYVREEQPLGTGGAIRRAWKDLDNPCAWVLNGDTYTDFSWSSLWAFHQASSARCTLALKQMSRFDRYGTVKIDGNGKVIGFVEKQAVDLGLINAGVYLVDRNILDDAPPQERFSFEQDVLEVQVTGGKLAGMPVRGHFLDIGVPDDYHLAQTAIPEWSAGGASKELPKPDQSWTLFLDRDGVMNERIPDDYVRLSTQFQWLPGAIDALLDLRSKFGRVVVVTNQQGIGKGLMTESDLTRVHERMKLDLRDKGVQLDGIYFCPSLAVDHPICRKPLPGMALQALSDFPEIRFDRSVLIGDSPSDIAFGSRLGMFTICIGEQDDRADWTVSSLAEASGTLLEQ
ncbi:MAG: HAD-IIIA family hydrolase [Saprospiraceae bacterium]|nr:HAD-IIIA family hydrolase [Saprospiraceae bacterium]